MNTLVLKRAWIGQELLVLVLFLVALCAPLRGQGKALDLTGYIDENGAITVQRHGDTVDPYFALQALLLAQTHGLDTAAPAAAWFDWLATRYQARQLLDRHCKNEAGWWPCKSADADDASLALWLAFLKTRHPGPLKSARVAALTQLARRDLEALRDRRTGLYRVSPRLPHSLFMDNLEVWSVQARPSLARAIQSTFWDPQLQIYRVSTQSAHPHPMAVFYPDATAQIYPLLMKFPHIPGGPAAFYSAWMAQHRRSWLAQMHTDFAWGLIALLAWEQGDLETVACWQQQALPLRHGLHWTVTDEVVFQILPSPPLSLTTLQDCT